MNRPPSFSLPRKAGLAFFIACCLLSTLRIVHDTPTPAHLRADEIADRSDHRFAALKAELPARGVIGYIGEEGNSALPDYYLAQYALAPLVLDRGFNHSLVVGNFPASGARVIPSGLDEVKDFGKGVLLLRNRDAAR
jgi:hypothetical protein